MTSPLPGDADDPIGRSVAEIMSQIEEPQVARVRPREAVDETAPIWLIDVLPLHLKDAYHAFWGAIQTFEHYIEDHPRVLRVLLLTIILSCLLVAMEVLWRGGL